MKMAAVVCRLTVGLGSLGGAVDLVAPAARLVWTEGPQLSDWIGICTDLVASIADLMA